MNRWIVAALVTLAVVVLVSPGIVGRLAEKNLRNSIAWAEHENEGLVVTEEKFERGWFTAAGRYRIELEDGPLRSRLAGLAEAADPQHRAALIVETRIDHGLLPVTSLSRDSGSLQPALASTVSTLQIDPGDGQLIDLPGKLTSTIGLTGETASRYLLAAGTFHGEDLDLQWTGADVRFTIDAGASAMRYDGSVEPLSVRADGQASRVEAVRFAGSQQKTPYGFDVGELALQVQALSLAGAPGAATRFDSLRLAARDELTEGRIAGSTSLDVHGLSLGSVAGADLGMDVAVARLDATALAGIVEALRSARAPADPDPDPGTALSGAYRNVETDLASLLAKGGELRIDRFELALPQGQVSATLRLDLAETAGNPFSWPAALLALTVAAEARIPAALVQALQARNPEAGGLVAMGFLRRDGDAYVIEANYARGLITVNGAPMALPLGTLTGSDLHNGLN